jgi:hypothetical protein
LARRRQLGLVSHAVDRLLAEERIGAGVDIEGEQGAGRFDMGSHRSSIFIMARPSL